MIHIRTDPSGFMAKLKCDLCGRKSLLYEAGARVRDLDRLRARLRVTCAGNRWVPIQLRGEGAVTTGDCCPRCAARIARETALLRD